MTKIILDFKQEFVLSPENLAQAFLNMPLKEKATFFDTIGVLLEEEAHAAQKHYKQPIHHPQTGYVALNMQMRHMQRFLTPFGDTAYKSMTVINDPEQ